MGLSARPSTSGLTHGSISRPRSPSSTPCIRRSRCVCRLSRHVFAINRLTLLVLSTRPPLAGRRPTHGSRCPLEADHGMVLGSIPRQSEAVNPHRFTVSSKTQYLCARTGARTRWRATVRSPTLAGYPYPGIPSLCRPEYPLSATSRLISALGRL